MTRKGSSDVQLYFEDNSKGIKTEDGYDFSEGFAIDFYLADLISSGSATRFASADNCRISITSLQNHGANLNLSALGLMSAANANSALDALKSSSDIVTERRFEFMAYDNTLSEVNSNPAIRGTVDTTKVSLDTSAVLENYKEFSACFLEQSEYIPQVVLLKEILNERGYTVSTGTTKDMLPAMMIIQHFYLAHNMIVFQKMMCYMLSMVEILYLMLIRHITKQQFKMKMVLNV